MLVKGATGRNDMVSTTRAQRYNKHIGAKYCTVTSSARCLDVYVATSVYTIRIFEPLEICGFLYEMSTYHSNHLGYGIKDC